MSQGQFADPQWSVSAAAFHLTPHCPVLSVIYLPTVSFLLRHCAVLFFAAITFAQ